MVIPTNYGIIYICGMFKIVAWTPEGFREENIREIDHKCRSGTVPRTHKQCAPSLIGWYDDVCNIDELQMCTSRLGWSTKRNPLGQIQDCLWELQKKSMAVLLSSSCVCFASVLMQAFYDQWQVLLCRRMNKYHLRQRHMKNHYYCQGAAKAR